MKTTDPTFQERVPRNLSQHVAREIGTSVIRGDWKPGDTLPDEPSLCEQLGVSRTVVREAVKILAAKGLIEVRPRRGTTVLPRKRWQRLDSDLLAWQQTITPTREVLQQLLEVRRIIEPEVAALAAERADLRACKSIRAAYQAMQEVVDSADGYVVADAAFHAAVLRAAENEFLDALEAVIFAGLQASIRVTNPRPENNRSSLKLHEAVADAIEARDPDRARKAMQELLADASLRIANSTL
ncbi:FadR/GntR family transcriptional regulator [Azospirillum sp. ST 5-10]|uniref:FadR/GntR family transcriptional regulator n=1 Tax=unclassified Azospirillum TaxID=2630922 RepID=UPI003F49CB7A